MNFPILTSLIALPIIGALALLFMRDDEQNEPVIRNVALVVSVLVFLETLLLWARFDSASAEFQFVERHAWIPAFGITYAVGVDGISLLLLVLTGFLTPIALLCSWESVHRKTRAFCIFMLLLDFAGMLVQGVRLRRDLDRGEMLAVVPWLVIGMGVGVTALVLLPAQTLLATLGITILAYAASSLRADASRLGMKSRIRYAAPVGNWSRGTSV